MTNAKLNEVYSKFKKSDNNEIKWCYVNTENEFEFLGSTYIIDNTVEQYKVYNKSGDVENYTNEAYMEQILAVLSFGELHFFDQYGECINNDLIGMVS